MIEIENLHKSYRDNHVLRGLSFTVPNGQVTGLVGPNGAGKSTAIRILTGYSDADLGTVRINGKLMHINAVATKHLVGYAPENAPSYREQTVAEYLQFIGQIRGLKGANLTAEINRAVAAFSLNKVFKQAIGTLSKGYRHRVSLAQCLLGDPPIIILDEPTDGLDPIQKIETRKIILELAKTKAVLLTTHLLEEVEMLCDRVVVIGQGQVTFSGTISEVINAGAIDTIVHLRVADCRAETLTTLLHDMDKLLTAKYYQQGTSAQAQLSFAASAQQIDMLDLVSQKLHSQSLRIIELKKETPALTRVFEKQAKTA